MPGDAASSSVDPPTVAEVTAHRAELVDSGYRPVEVMNHNANHPNAGKAAIREGWQEGRPLVF